MKNVVYKHHLKVYHIFMTSFEWCDSFNQGSFSFLGLSRVFDIFW